MIEIRDLLARFSSLLTKGEFKKETIRNVIGGVIGVNIDSDKIKIKNGTIYLDIKPIYKNEIALKRELIEEKLREVLGDRAPKEIL